MLDLSDCEWSTRTFDDSSDEQVVAWILLAHVWMLNELTLLILRRILLLLME